MFNSKKSITVIAVLFLLATAATSCKKESDNNTDNTSTIVFNPSLTYGTTTDQEGNTYKTIKIGNQTWMAENLRVTKYNDGALISRILVDSALYATVTGAYDNYNGTDNTDTIRNMGRLYNWYAASSARLAPIGWHVATQAEWDTLVANLGGNSVAGGKLKEVGTTHWSTPNEGATNASGFSAVPSGRFYITGPAFTNFSYSAYYWSSSSYNGGTAMSYSLAHTDAGVWRGANQKKNGFSIRCVKD